jgi:hypothetical protein
MNELCIFHFVCLQAGRPKWVRAQDPKHRINCARPNNACINIAKQERRFGRGIIMPAQRIGPPSDNPP